MTTVVSGTGQIKPKTYVNIGATAMGRVTRLFVKEGDQVKKGETVATVENVQQQATVNGQEAAMPRQNRHRFLCGRGKDREANVEHAKADLEQKKLDWDRAQELYKDGIMAKQDFDAKKAAYDTDVASLDQAIAGENQAKANTDSARGHLKTQQATLQANEDMLKRTIAVAPFDGIVTNEPIREGETVVEGIQDTEGSTLMTIADMSVVTAEVKVDETDIVNVKLGQSADVSVDALPGKVFKGMVTLVGDQALLRSTGIATSQSTTGTEEAKDFKVVVTHQRPQQGFAARSLLHGKDHDGAQGQRTFIAYTGAHHARSRGRYEEDERRSSGGLCPAGRQRAGIESHPGSVRGSEGFSWPVALQVRSRHHRHQRRYRYRSALRTFTRRRNCDRPLQDSARTQGRIALEARHPTGYSHNQQWFLEQHN